MTSFKYKPNKIKYLDEVITLDSKHKELAGKFKSNREELESKKEKIIELTAKLKKLNTNSDLDFKVIKKKGAIRQEIRELEDQIKDTENNTSEINYYKEVGDYIIDYYNEDKDMQYNDMKSNDIEERKEIKETKDTLDLLNEISKQKRKPKRNTKKRVKVVPTNRRTILDYYGGGATETVKDETIYSEGKLLKPNDETETAQATDTEKGNDKLTSAKKKATLLEQYMNIVDTSYNVVRTRQLPMCKTCNIEKLLLQNEGMYVCTTCGEFENVIIESDVPNYKDQLQEKPAYNLGVRRTEECGFVRIWAAILSLIGCGIEV